MPHAIDTYRVHHRGAEKCDKEEQEVVRASAPRVEEAENKRDVGSKLDREKLGALLKHVERGPQSEELHHLCTQLRTSKERSPKVEGEFEARAQIAMRLNLKRLSVLFIVSYVQYRSGGGAETLGGR